MSNAAVMPPERELLSAADIAETRRHPGFRAAVEAYCAANLTRYHALAPIERWMVSDTGRASLSATVLVLDATTGLTPAALGGAVVVTSGEVSRGRARLYLQRAVANGLIEPVDPGARLTRDAALRPSPRLHAVMVGVLRLAVRYAATLAPEAAPAVPRLDDPAFMRRAAIYVGAITPGLKQFFPLDSPVQLFQARDGGSRVLEELVTRQHPGRERLLQTCAYSHSALARASLCSRTHVIQLLRDVEARGYVRLGPRSLTITPELSNDAEQYYAGAFTIARTAAAWALAES